MKTPAGKDCRYYYEDFNRGRQVQECRMLKANLDSPAWKTQDCFRCPVPEILWANSSEYLELLGTVRIGFLGLSRRVHVDAFCRKHEQPIEDPYVGCLHCAADRPNIMDLLTDTDLQ